MKKMTKPGSKPDSISVDGSKMPLRGLKQGRLPSEVQVVGQLVHCVFPNKLQPCIGF